MGGGGGSDKFEDVDSVGGGGNAEEGGGGVERHAVDSAGHRAAPELVEFARRGDREDADDGAFVGGGGEEGAGVVEGDAGEGRAVGFDDVDGFKFEGVEEENVAGGGGDVGCAGWSVGRWGEGGGEGFLGKRVGQVAVLRRG